eukprot:6179398-Pleurochrysis_carterae.AAC.1
MTWRLTLAQGFEDNGNTSCQFSLKGKTLRGVSGAGRRERERQKQGSDDNEPKRETGKSARQKGRREEREQGKGLDGTVGRAKHQMRGWGREGRAAGQRASPR